MEAIGRKTKGKAYFQHGLFNRRFVQDKRTDFWIIMKEEEKKEGEEGGKDEEGEEGEVIEESKGEVVEELEGEVVEEEEVA